MPIRNFTPHTIVIEPNIGGSYLTIPSEGVARVEEESSPQGAFEGVSLRSVRYGAVTGLPEPVEGVLLVVSGMVLDAVADLHAAWSAGWDDPGAPPPRSAADLAAPGWLIRDAEGRPTRCRSFRVRR